jgi:frataxin
MLRNLLRWNVFAQLTEKEFLLIAHQKLEQLSELIENISEDTDLSSTQNILTLRKGTHTIVINTQTPNRQLWYSSTISGPQRFDWEEQ